MKKYCILGTDKRSTNLKMLYENENKVMATYNNADIIIAPTPFSKDDTLVNGEDISCSDLFDVLSNTNKVLYAGAISKNMKQSMFEKNVVYFDLLEFENVAILNAIPTAEGAIATAMEITDFTLHGSHVLVLGYGKIGKILAKMLSGIGAKVFCEARNEKDIAKIDSMGYNSIELSVLDKYLSSMDVIFNTVPSLMLDYSRLKMLKKSCCIIDISSSPGGVDFEIAKKLGLNVVWALALPTKVAPVTAALYLKQTIDKLEGKNER